MAETPSLDIPVVAPQLTAQLEHTHVLLRITPEPTPQFAYELAAPQGWAYSAAFGPVSDGPLLPRSLGFVAGAADPDGPVIGVTATAVPFEIPVDTWTRMSFAAEGWTVVAAEWFPGATGLFFDITGTRTVDNVQQVRRTSARADGSHIFCVNCFTSRAKWDQTKEIFWVAHATFKLLKGTGTTRMEPWAGAETEAPPFRFAYPVSWSAQPVASPVPGVSAVDLRLMNAKADVLLAYLQVQAVRLDEGEPVPSLEALAAKGKGRLAKAGYQETQPMAPLGEEQDPRQVATEGWLGGLEGRGRLAQADVIGRLGFVHRGRVVVTFMMICPVPQDDLLVALRAQRAFEIARGTLEIG
jgi:hypothetical protein